MRNLIPWLWVAGGLQLLILIANFFLPKRLNCRENLARVSPMVRSVFVVHWIYIVVVLGIFTALCFWFAPELAGASRLGRFLSAFIAAFWLCRVPIQVLYYDAELRRQNRLGDVAFLLAFSYLGVIFGAAALGLGR